MSHPDKTEVSAFIDDLAVRAGDLALEMRSRAKIVVQKGAFDFATDADIALENLIRSELAVRFPQIPFIGEESAAPSSIPAEAFVVDPIDGTTNFASGSADWGVSIGYLHESKFAAGAISLPVHGSLISSCAARGTLVDGAVVDLSSSERIPPPRIGLIGIDALLRQPDVLQQTWLLELLSRYSGVLSSGAAICDLANVVRSRTSICVCFAAHLWDVAAGAAAVEAAGGVVRNFWGEVPSWSTVKTGPLLFGKKETVEAVSAMTARFVRPTKY